MVSGPATSHHLEIYLKCVFSGPSLEILNQKLQGWRPRNRVLTRLQVIKTCTKVSEPLAFRFVSPDRHMYTSLPAGPRRSCFGIGSLHEKKKEEEEET